MSVSEEFSYVGGADVSKFRFGKKQKGFYSGNRTIEVGNGLFVLKIVYGTNSSQNKPCTFFFGKIDGEGVVGGNLDTGIVFVIIADAFQSFLQREIALFGVVYADGDNYLIHQGQSSSDQRFVPDSKGVEGTREESRFPILSFVFVPSRIVFFCSGCSIVCFFE